MIITTANDIEQGHHIHLKIKAFELYWRNQGQYKSGIMPASSPT
jgi:hypothetical protein